MRRIDAINTWVCYSVNKFTVAYINMEGKMSKKVGTNNGYWNISNDEYPAKDTAKTKI